MKPEAYRRNIAARAFDVARYLLPFGIPTGVGQVTSIRTLERQVRRLLGKLKAEGDRAVVHGLRGRPSNRRIDEENGQTARTEFRVLCRNEDGTALVEARPLTGRTNQIRVHLWQLGLPVCGDPAYLPDRELGRAMTLPPDAPPLRLHAWRLELRHPVTGASVTFRADPDFAADARLGLRDSLVDQSESTAFRLLHGGAST